MCTHVWHCLLRNSVEQFKTQSRVENRSQLTTLHLSMPRRDNRKKHLAELKAIHPSQQEL